MSEFTRASWAAQGQIVGGGKVGTGKKTTTTTTKTKTKTVGRRKVNGKRLLFTFPRLAPVSFRFSPRSRRAVGFSRRDRLSCAS